MVMLTSTLNAQWIRMFGLKGHTTWTAFLTSLGFALWAIPAQVPHFVAIVVQGMGYGRHDTVMGAGLKWCEAAGMGKGEASAHFQALRGFTAIVMPMFYARFYARGLSMDMPGICFFFATAWSLFG